MDGDKHTAALRETVVRLAATKPNEQPMKLAKAIAALEARAPKCVDDRLSKSTGISRRVLYHHLAIGQTLGHLNVTPERLAPIGWKKLTIIAQYLKEKGVEGKKRDALALRAIRLAEKSTVAELPGDFE